MCLVVDTCAIGDLFKTNSVNGAILREWIENRRGKLVYTGNCLRASRSLKFKQYIDQLTKRGMAKYVSVSDELVSATKHKIKSNDEKKMALAIAANANVIYTFDALLSDDFMNDTIRDTSRCKVVGVDPIDSYEMRRTYCASDMR